MPTNHQRTIALGFGLALVASCTADVPTDSNAPTTALSLVPAAGKVRVCHKPGSVARILEIGADGVADHLAHGDYISTLLVSHDAAQPADHAHFTTISNALAAARTSRAAAGETTAAACRITILVSSDTYQGTIGSVSGILEHFPLVVDFPDITLHGAFVMGLDAAGRATGDGVNGGQTTLTPLEPLPFDGSVSTPIIIANGHPNGSAGNGLEVQGFVFQSGHDPVVDAGGQAILSLRTTGLTIRGNRFEGGFTESIDLRASSASVLENHLGGTAGTCDVCLAGPGAYHAQGNRLLAGGIPGIVASPTVGLPVPPEVEPFVLPATAEMWADVRNNEVRDHQRLPVGVGIRMDAVGVAAPNVHGTIHAIVQDNTLLNNRFGMIVHAAFPTATTDRRGDVDLTLGGNVFQGSCEVNLLVSFARHTTALGLTNNPYLLNSTFRLTLGGDVSWEDVWFSHPAGFGNTLEVDGGAIANGARQFYHPEPCSVS
jgi:hypothetical protein